MLSRNIGCLSLFHRFVSVARLHNCDLVANACVLSNLGEVRLVEEEGSVTVAQNVHTHLRAIGRGERVGLASVTCGDLQLQKKTWFSSINNLNIYEETEVAYVVLRSTVGVKDERLLQTDFPCDVINHKVLESSDVTDKLKHNLVVRSLERVEAYSNALFQSTVGASSRHLFVLVACCQGQKRGRQRFVVLDLDLV